MLTWACWTEKLSRSPVPDGGSGGAVAIDCAAAGAKVVVADYGVEMDGSEPTSDVADAVVAEIKARRRHGRRRRGATCRRWRAARRIVDARHRRMGLHRRRRVRGGHPARAHALQHVRGGVGRRACASTSRARSPSYRAAAAVMRKQERRVRSSRSLRRVGARRGRSGQLRRGQGRHRVALLLGAALGLTVRRHRQRDRAGGPHPHVGQRARWSSPRWATPKTSRRWPSTSCPTRPRHVTGQVYTVVGNKIAVWNQPEGGAGDVHRRAVDARGDRQARLDATIEPGAAAVLRAWSRVGAPPRPSGERPNA